MFFAFNADYVFSLISLEDFPLDYIYFFTFVLGDIKVFTTGVFSGFGVGGGGRPLCPVVGLLAYTVSLELALVHGSVSRQRANVPTTSLLKFDAF